MDDYFSFCESLWQAWLKGDLEAPPIIERTFNLQAAPEPYLSFGAGPRALVAVTTNPGATMPHQVRAVVLAGSGPVNPTMSYHEAAHHLGSFYEQQLKGQARRRIAALRKLAQFVGTEGVLQVEACPFHSPSLPKKAALLSSVAQSGLLAEYVDHLREFIQERPTVVVSAISSRAELGPELRLSRWLAWQAEIGGVQTEGATFVPLIEKVGKITCGAFISSANGATKALVLMMGGNHLPGEAGLRALSEAFQHRGHTG